MLQEKAQAERKAIVTEFECLRQFLQDQERRLLARLEELDKEIEKRREDLVTKLSEELSRLGDVITEMEAKCKQPASEFLQVRLFFTKQTNWKSLVLPGPGKGLWASGTGVAEGPQLLGCGLATSLPMHVIGQSRA